jgi:hypothetical protein
VIQLSYETSNDVFTHQDIETIFNSFLNTYLRIFYYNFTKIQIKIKTNYNPWMTKGIRYHASIKETYTQLLGITMIQI